MDSNAHPYRSVLYIPGSKERALEKARALPTDAIIFDLEDAVAPDAKAEARATLVEALRQGGYGKRAKIARINALTTEWGLEDARALREAGADAILLPKVNNPSDIDNLSEVIGANLPVWTMMETPACVFNARDIAAHRQVTGLVAGTNDLTKDLGCRVRADRLPLMTALQRIVMAARAARIVAVDGVYNRFRDGDGLKAECEQGRDLPFGQINLGTGGGKGGVGYLDLRGVDERLAVETEIAPLLAFRLEPVAVTEPVIDPVHRHDPRRPCGHHDHLQRGHQRQPVGAHPATEILRQVVGARHQPRHLPVRRDLARVEHAHRRFHHRPDRQVGADHLGEVVDIRGRVDLGQQDRIRSRLAERAGILQPPFRGQRVDPHDPRALAIAALPQRRDQRLARLGLGVGGHRILQVEYDRIGRQLPRLFERALLRAGDIKHRTIGVGGAGHVVSLRTG